jgi:hypothetical protein
MEHGAKDGAGVRPIAADGRISLYIFIGTSRRVRASVHQGRYRLGPSGIADRQSSSKITHADDLTRSSAFGSLGAASAGAQEPPRSAMASLLRVVKLIQDALLVH